MAEEEMNIEDDAIALEDSEDSNTTDVGISGIANYVIASFKKAEDYRYDDETRWVRAYRNLQRYIWT
tara:strand:- start:389 stop:589 length:201 start_codon:yes stop_codon:yes gene_type:complete